MVQHNLRVIVNKHLAESRGARDGPDLADAGAQKIYIEALFKKYRKLLQRFLERRLHNKEDAQELLQETYVKLLKRETLSHLDENVKGYIFKIASNLIVDKLRSEQSKRVYEHVPLDETEASDRRFSPQQQMEWQSAIDQLKTALMELPLRPRQVFVLHRFNNLSYSEIAQTLGVTTRTVERDMSTAMAFCEQRLKEFL